MKHSKGVEVKLQEEVDIYYMLQYCTATAAIKKLNMKKELSVVNMIKSRFKEQFEMKITVLFEQ